MSNVTPNPGRDRVAEALQLRATQLGLSGRRAADTAGISEATWRRILRGQPADALSVTKAVRALILDEDEARELLRLLGLDPAVWVPPPALDAARDQIRTAQTALARAAEALARLSVGR